MEHNNADQPFDSFPEWMRPDRRSIDAGLVFALVLSLIAAWPFLARPGLPRETDAELHVFRTAELTHVMRQGVLYTRWAPDFYYGYGYPFYNYYGSLTYYAGSAYSLLTGADAMNAMRFVSALGILGAGVGAYVLARRTFGQAGALLACAVYVLSPYVSFVDPHMRGDIAEAFAFGVFPWMLWAFDRLLIAGRPHHLILAVILLAAQLFTHNLMALVFFAMLLGWMAWQAVIVRPEGAHWRPALLGIALGLGAGAFFWLPVALEANAVQLGNLIGPGHFDYRNHFLSLGELFGPSRTLDMRAANPAYALNLGTAAWTLGTLGTLRAVYALARRKNVESAVLYGLFFAAGAALLIFLMTPASAFLWDAVPMMAFLQFPWRLLGPASFCLAMSAGMLLSGWQNVAHRRALMLAALIVPAASALPTLYPPAWPADFGDSGIRGHLSFELSGYALGTTATGDFLPENVITVPGPQDSLVNSYFADGPVDKVNRATIPPESSVDVIDHGPLGDRFLVQGPEAFVLRLYTFMFPGWRAYVDDVEVPIELGMPEGFITLWVPAGVHEVAVTFNPTPPRLIAWAVTAGSLIVTMGAAFLMRGQTAPTPAAPNALQAPDLLALAGLALIFVAVRALLIPQPGFTWTESPPGSAAAEHDIARTFENGITLIGYDLPRKEIRAAESLDLTLYWRVEAPITENVQVFVHLIGIGDDQLWAQSDKLNPGDYPTSRWDPAQYVRDPHTLQIPANAPPGPYIIKVGLWDCQNYTLTACPTSQRLHVLNEDGTPADDRTPLLELIEITP